MLTDDELQALREYAARVTDRINRYLIEDIAERIAAAGKLAGTDGALTATAQYEALLAETLGAHFVDIRRELKMRLAFSNRQIDSLFPLTAQKVYTNQAERLGASFLSFEQNTTLQQTVRAAVSLADKDFRNITQTLGMVDRHGNERPLKRYYNAVMDDVFSRVFTGAADYSTAVRDACRAMADKGVTSIGYESGVKTALEAAVRRNVMGGLGLMAEEISEYNHEALGADGWEISAHARSAPDHEPIQGKMYADEAYKRLNSGLKRRIGTLNCGHVASPIILGVNRPQHTEEQLRGMAEENAKGVTVDGRHYTLYAATQEMRRIERAIRAQKRLGIAYEAAKLPDARLDSDGRLHRLQAKYKAFASAAGLRTQDNRLFVAQGKFKTRA